MTTVPDGLPTLARGQHEQGDGLACVMEYVSVLTGTTFSDYPPCTDEVFARLAQIVNDSITDRHRPKLVNYIDRLAAAEPSAAFRFHLEQLLINKYGQCPEEHFLYGTMQMANSHLYGLLFPTTKDGLVYADETIGEVLAFLDEVLDLHHKVTNVEVKPIPPEELARAKMLIETKALINVGGNTP